jgi:hypothetical protein
MCVIACSKGLALGSLIEGTCQNLDGSRFVIAHLLMKTSVSYANPKTSMEVTLFYS